jgi:hypothetical protein
MEGKIQPNILIVVCIISRGVMEMSGLKNEQMWEVANTCIHQHSLFIAKHYQNQVDSLIIFHNLNKTPFKIANYECHIANEQNPHDPPHS